MRETSLDATLIALCFTATVLLGAWIGSVARTRLPQHHLDDDTKDMVKIGVGFLATLAALVLGLVVGAAKGSFDTKTAEVQTTAARILELDRTLRTFGPGAAPVREYLRRTVAAHAATLGSESYRQFVATSTAEQDASLSGLQTMLGTLAPKNDVERAAAAKALRLADEIEQILSLAAAQTGSSITMPLLVLLVFWFAVIAAGWNLFAPRNGTTVVINVLCAVSLGGAIFLLLEMDTPFGGMIRISSQPLHAVLTQLPR